MYQDDLFWGITGYLFEVKTFTSLAVFVHLEDKFPVNLLKIKS